jgi:hypothetical protein
MVTVISHGKPVVAVSKFDPTQKTTLIPVMFEEQGRTNGNDKSAEWLNKQANRNVVLGATRTCTKAIVDTPENRETFGVGKTFAGHINRVVRDVNPYPNKIVDGKPIPSREYTSKAGEKFQAWFVTDIEDTKREDIVERILEDEDEILQGIPPVLEDMPAQ